MIKVVGAPTPQLTVLDVLLDALGLTGVLLIGSALGGLLVGGVLIGLKKWHAARRGADEPADGYGFTLGVPFRPGR